MFSRIFRKAAWLQWEFRQKKRLGSIRGLDPTHVIDIDNTLTVFEAGGKINQIDPPPRQNMVLYVKRLIDLNRKVIYISARDFRIYKPTLSWLDKQGILQSSESVFFVRNAMQKVDYLKVLVRNNRNIEYIDDLSYNHENGDVRFYEAVIEEVRKLPLTYRGVEFIEAK
jgi:hypothetical protein